MVSPPKAIGSEMRPPLDPDSHTPALRWGVEKGAPDCPWSSGLRKHRAQLAEFVRFQASLELWGVGEGTCETPEKSTLSDQLHPPSDRESLHMASTASLCPGKGLQLSEALRTNPRFCKRN